MESEEIKITGHKEHVNRYLESMINHWRKTQGNAYSWLLTLNPVELIKMATKEENEKDDEFDEIVCNVAMMAYSMEKGRETGSFTAEIDDFCAAIQAFRMMCSLASLEVQGFLKVTDKSYFFVPEGDITLAATEQMLRYMCENE